MDPLIFISQKATLESLRSELSKRHLMQSIRQEAMNEKLVKRQLFGPKLDSRRPISDNLPIDEYEKFFLNNSCNNPTCSNYSEKSEILKPSSVAYDNFRMTSTPRYRRFLNDNFENKSVGTSSEDIFSSDDKIVYASKTRSSSSKLKDSFKLKGKTLQEQTETSTSIDSGICDHTRNRSKAIEKDDLTDRENEILSVDVEKPKEDAEPKAPSSLIVNVGSVDGSTHELESGEEDLRVENGVKVEEIVVEAVEEHVDQEAGEQFEQDREEAIVEEEKEVKAENAAVKQSSGCFATLMGFFFKCVKVFFFVILVIAVLLTFFANVIQFLPENLNYFEKAYVLLNRKTLRGGPTPF